MASLNKVSGCQVIMTMTDNWKCHCDPQTGNTYISETTTGRMTIPTANLGFSTTPSARNWHRVIATRTDNRKWQYIRSGRQSCNFWKWIIVAIIWLIFYRARHVRKSGIWRWNFDAICQSSRDVIISGLGAISLSILIALVLTCQHYFPQIHGLKP